MNWGWKITLVYTVFVAGILTLVFKSRTTPVDLVSKDYYAQELAYSERLEAQRNSATLTALPKVNVSTTEITLLLPVESTQASDVKMQLYCPSNAANDRCYDLLPQPRQAWSASDVNNGLYIAKISFRINDKSYYHEQAVEKK
jgi:hypothetical protein